MAVTESVLNIVTEHAQRAGAARISVIHLVIGQLSGFVDDSIQFYFDLLTPGTLAAGAQLAIQHVPALLQCRDCGAQFALEGMDWRCPSCGALAGDVISGKEFYVESIEVS
jgi:hydrogenase nickel incorporation protein HypA/HybF